ncbi:enoyl, partial [Lasius niger]
MAGLTDAALVIHACQAGLMGSLGAGTMEPAAIRAAIHSIRAGTERVFNINLFIVDAHEGHVPDPAVLAVLHQYLETLAHEEAPDVPLLRRYAPSFAGQFAVLLDEAPPVASFTFGILSPERVAALQERGVTVIGTATTAREAKAWEQVGADAVCLQGIEAGGHRGGFLEEDFTGVGLLALIPACRAAVDIPVIAAGGIMTGS